MEYLRNFVYSFYDVSENSFNEFVKIANNKSFNKNHEIVSLGEIPKYFYILKSGVVRAYLIDDKGKEHTRTIYTPPTTTSNLSSLITKQPSNLIYECLTDCEFIECDYDAFYQLSSQHHDLSIFHYKVLEKIYIREETRILELSMLNATDRYQILLDKFPKIDQTINQYHIASFLNITPVQLSRIKKNLLKN